MKGKRSGTEDKIRILRKEDTGQSIGEAWKEYNLPQVSFHRWKKQFRQMGVNETKRLKDPERENGELKKMLAAPRPAAVSYTPQNRSSLWQKSSGHQPRNNSDLT